MAQMRLLDYNLDALELFFIKNEHDTYLKS